MTKPDAEAEARKLVRHCDGRQPMLIAAVAEVMRDSQDYDDLATEYHDLLFKAQRALDMRCVSDPEKVTCADTLHLVPQEAEKLRAERDALRTQVEALMKLVGTMHERWHPEGVWACVRAECYVNCYVMQVLAATEGKLRR
jgi:hypothetical protein